MDAKRAGLQMKGLDQNLKGRMRVLFALMMLCFVGVVARLVFLQIIRYDWYVQKATTLQTRDAIVTPNRGTIYDTNLQVLAESASTQKVTVNPNNVVDEKKKDQNGNEISAETQQQTLARVLSDTLGLKYDSVLTKVCNTKVQYVEIATRQDKDSINALIAALEQADCSRGVDYVPDTKRYYTYSAYLANVLGYVSGEGKGVYGLEAAYENVLAGTAGRIVRAQNAINRDLQTDYEQYIPARDGDSLKLTIDSDIQSYLEKHLETALADNPQARDGVSGIVLEVKTGAVLGMASLPDFDPNEPRQISDERSLSELRSKVEKILTDAGITVEIPEEYYRKGGMDNLPQSLHNNDAIIDQLGAARTEQMYKMWYNPVVSDTYEPGSTFKLMNVATAYELGLTNENDRYYCGGSMMVGDWSSPIKCWKTGGHGMLTLEETLVHSCNVGMMQIAAKIGKDRFYEFYKAFGMTSKTGIDLPSESQGIFHDVKSAASWNDVSLAVASFGQRFTVTPIQMASMVAAIVDDGKLKTPYVVREVVDNEGAVKSTTQSKVVRQVISAQTSAFMRKAMESVVDGGTGKNAYVAGYRVGGKTATSEIEKMRDENGVVIDEEDRYTASFIGVAPMDDPQVVVLVAVQDLPYSAPHGGGAVAAPVVGRIMEDVLPYLGVTPKYSDSEKDRREMTVPSVIGKTSGEAQQILQEAGFDCRLIGEQEVVTDQVPAGGIKIPVNGTVLLYLGQNKPTDAITVPDLIGLSPSECRARLSEYGLYLKQKGVASAQVTGGTTASRQNPVAGTQVNIGAVITVEFANTTDVDDR